VSAPVRVALVIGQLHPGGSERQLYELARGLSGGPCEPLVYCLSETVEPFGGALRSQGIPVRVVPRRRRFELRRVRALAKLLREDRIDVINSFSQHVNLYAYLAARRARGVPLVTSNRSTEPRRGRRVEQCVDAFVFRRSRWVVVNSSAGSEFTQSMYAVRPDRIVVIPNGVDPKRFDPVGDPGALRAELGIPPSAPVAGVVGRLSPEKRVDLFLRAAAQVLSRVPESRFLVVGGGEPRGDLKALASSLGLGARAIFTGARSDVAALLAAMDLLVLASDFEGLPNSVMEAMAAGRPVVATDLGGCRELVSPGETGFLVPTGSAHALGEKMAAILELPDRGRAMGRAGLERIRIRFGVDLMARRFEELYLRCVRESAALRPS
jgi:glycosyltransferase involved in cell wall biosynthesis